MSNDFFLKNIDKRISYIENIFENCRIYSIDKVLSSIIKKKILNVVPVGIYNLNLISDNYTQFFSNSEDTQRTEGFRKCSLETTLICLTNIFICDLAIHGKTLGNARTFVFTAPQHRAHSRTRNSNVYSWAVYNRIEHTKQID